MVVVLYIVSMLNPVRDSRLEPFEGFEKFRPAEGRVTINLTKAGFTLSTGFCRKYLSDEQLRFVEIYLDWESRRVAFRFCEDRGSSALIVGRANGAARIRAGSFYSDLSTSHSEIGGSYIPTVEEHEDGERIFLIQLPDSGNAATKGRARK